MSFASATLRIASGPLAWILHFAVLYGVTAVACARGMPQVVPWVIGLATVAAAGACLAIVASHWTRSAEFESWLAAGLAGLALFAILFQAFPVLVVPACR
jgi:hypothetical protein